MSRKGKPKRSSAAVRRLKAKLLGKDPRCHYCRKTLTNETATLDHFFPLSRGGTWEQANIKLACKRCNGAKSDRIPLGHRASRRWQGRGVVPMLAWQEGKL